ncbi:MAG: hypothetical protein A2W90_08080 [Bacteroidetes bacterium GWF2_42_66]|nr:MAG: hypothetical protein A2W92_20705 [Bacteroidetes bacterium GWA2_42_15]OFX99740.1 MAG: hypothetical protein A2W89_03245 [Bacteroidetes bacterium GWE2_42_39]OFY39778.1 MAG: hypothetical protein A2W90_08080 [Bacteroidetes bacterium GWF2_42_66]HBL74791.1 hypothetical protein [Prolixibacteraceae bacterium]HCR90753.1 hypothetical protein [Prolixibacteraceae bacterium]
MEQKNIPWNAISSYLSNNNDEEQLEVIRRWLTESEDHPFILREIINTWQLTRKKTTFYEPDKDILWKKLMFRIGHHPEKKKQIATYLKWIAAAAVVLLIFVTGVWTGNNSFRHTSALAYTTVMSPAGSRTRIILPDSSVVWLNSEAEIRYPAAFEKRSREVFVSGECFFDVTKDAKRQFTVHCTDFNVKVFGTSFNIRQSKKNNHTEVSLVEGKVQILNKADQPLTLLDPGEQFVFKGEKGIKKKIDNVEALTAWRNNMLIFENEPVETVIQTLESWYGVEFRVDTAILNNHRYTFKVKTESLREVLEMISVITPIEYTIEGEIVTMRYK